MFAFGNKHPYHEVGISTQIKSPQAIALAVHDQRHYVANGTKKATYCGSLRSGVGIPYDITTKSGKPLADDVLEVISHALQKNGNSVHQVTTQPGKSKETILAELTATQAPHGLYISIQEWKTDTYMNADLYCLVLLQVLDNNGNVLAENNVKASREAFGGSFWNPKKAAKKGALKALKMKLEALINHPIVLDVFK
ncbi:MAG TPA: hypothetical protein PLL90_12865 [Bacteroidales bacterium]|nr:hypothetical protein [Bacteroidales bacterium]